MRDHVVVHMTTNIAANARQWHEQTGRVPTMTHLKELSSLHERIVIM